MDPDLYALILHLTAGADGALPAYVGHQVQALFLDLVRQVDPELARVLHAHGPAKPYTVAAPLPAGRARDERVAVRAGATLALRVTLLKSDLFAPLTHALLQQTARPTLRLGALPLALADVRGTPGSDPWAGYGSFAGLAAAARPAKRLTIEFATPTAFSLGEDEDGRKRVGVLPDPHAVLGSLLRRWNALAPQPLDEAAAERATRRAVVARYDLRTTTFTLDRAPQIGFVGRCTYELRGDAEDRRALALLADAAFYLGAGMKTARGMGLCRRVAGDD